MTARWCMALLALGACLSQPPRPTLDERDGGADASIADARPAIDGSGEADATGADARPVGTGLPFPPVGVTPNITTGWTGDLNFDGIDDVVLVSDTGSAASAGVYVLFGRPGTKLANYHQFLATDNADPLAAIATQLDGVGGLDVVVYAVDFGTAAPNDSVPQLRAYKHEQDRFADPPLTNAVGGGGMSWQAPFNEGRQTGLIAANLAPGGGPSLLGVHERGGFVLTLPSWSDSNFTGTSPSRLTTGKSAVAITGGAKIPNGSNSAVDDVLLWTDESGNVTWLVNDGSGNLSPIIANGLARGPHHAELYDMDGTPPLDVITVIYTEVRAVPVDNDAGTTSVMYNGMNGITGVDSATDLLVFDSDQTISDPRPEIIISSASCEATSNGPCLYMIRNAYINGTNGQLNSPVAAATWPVPGSSPPRYLAHGDFDDDGTREVLVFSASGESSCVRIIDALFSSCD